MNFTPLTEAKEKLGHILVVDDDEISNFVYTRVITSSGVARDIHSFMTGQDALDFLQNTVDNHPYDFPEMIFLDINMPVMNGWDFLDKYKKMIPETMQEQTVLCMLSSSVYSEDINKANSYNQVKEYVPKPLTISMLNDLVEKYF